MNRAALWRRLRALEGGSAVEPLPPWAVVEVVDGRSLQRTDHGLAAVPMGEVIGVLIGGVRVDRLARESLEALYSRAAGRVERCPLRVPVLMHMHERWPASQEGLP